MTEEEGRGIKKERRKQREEKSVHLSHCVSHCVPWPGQGSWVVVVWFDVRMV